MRRFRVLLPILAILIIATSLFLFYLKSRRLPPTQFDWQAQVLTLAGDGSPVFRDAQEPTRAGFSDPFGIVIALDGTVYVSDAGDGNRIRKLTTQGTLVSLAGGNEGFADGSEALFSTPSGLAVDADGNIYVADTGNNRIRKVTREGVVSTVAGNGTAGYADGPALSSQFDGPIGISLDDKGNIYVADTYNDRIRKISVDNQVTTVAGAGWPGDVDGDAASARFNTPCGIVVGPDGTLIVADTGNNKLRKVMPTGQVTTMPLAFQEDPNKSWLRTPIGLALSHDGFLYVTEQDRGTIVQIAPDGKACVLAGNSQGHADGFADDARFNHPTGIAIDPRNGDLVVADSANYLVRRLSHETNLSPSQTSAEPLPRLNPETLGAKNLLWPLDPQDRPHEVVATIGEVRGSFDSTDSRDHLHSGLDVAGAYGDTVRTIRSEKVTSPLPNWGFGELSEGIRVGIVSYIHMHVGRDKDGNAFNDSRFVQVKADDGKISNVRVRRGTRFRPGDAIGTVNRMYHVHLIVGPSGGVVNPLLLSPVGFTDTIAPTIAKDGIQLFDEAGKRFTETDHGRLVVHGPVKVVVDAFDRSDMNSERRRLGLYSLGYQVFQSSSAAAPGFLAPRITILFNRLPADDNATKVAYAAESGITVYGSKTTRFLYDVTNTIRDGQARTGWWNTSELEKGNYILRIIAADYSGNIAESDVNITIK
jgi:sugar lactone lactonase YvrE